MQKTAKAIELICSITVFCFSITSALYGFYALHEFAEASGPSEFNIRHLDRLSTLLSFLLGYVAPIVGLLVLTSISFLWRGDLRALSTIASATVGMLTFVALLAFGAWIASMLSVPLSQIVWWIR